MKKGRFVVYENPWKIYLLQKLKEPIKEKYYNGIGFEATT